MDELVADFVCEAAEAFGGLQAGVARLALDGADREASHLMLRRLHGLKGLCSFVSFRRCEALIHAGESLLAALGQAPASPLALSRLSRMVEHLSTLLAHAAEHQAEPAGEDAELIADIENAAAQLRNAPWPVPVATGGAEPAVSPFLAQASWPETERRVRAPWSGLDALTQALGDRLGKRIELVVGGDDLRISAEAARPLRLALIALVRNACDHGVELPAERRAMGKPPLALLRLSVHRRAEGALIELADDGRGIAPAVQDKVFCAGFTTADAVGSISGRGLGLELVRCEVERLGGSVRLNSIPGHGAHFILTLPAAAVATPAARGRAAA